MGKTKKTFISSILRLVRGGSQDSDAETGGKTAKQVIPEASQSSEDHPGVVVPPNGTKEQATNSPNHGPQNSYSSIPEPVPEINDPESDDEPSADPKNRSIQEGYQIWEQYIQDRFEEPKLTPWESYINLTHLDNNKVMLHNYAFERGLTLDWSLDASEMLDQIDDYLRNKTDPENLIRYQFSGLKKTWPPERLEAFILQECRREGTVYTGPATIPYDEYMKQLKEIEETLQDNSQQQPSEPKEMDETLQDPDQQQAPSNDEEKSNTNETTDEINIKKKKSLKRSFIKIVTFSKVRHMLKAKTTK